MSLKLKLVSTISAFVLVLGLLFVGVWAANQGSVQMGGSVSFNATDVYARVTGSISGAGTGNATLPTLTFDADNETPDASGWQNLDLEFNAAGEPITIEVMVENLATDRSLTVNLKDNFSSEQGGLIKDVKNGDSKYTGSNVVLNASTGSGTSTTTFTITLSLSSKNNSLSNTTFGYTLNLYDASYEFPPAVQVTSVSSSGATTDTYTDLAGGVAIDGSIDLSGITFNTGETTLTISMTSLSANYIKNNVSWVNTSGVTISSTSLYLPQNPSEELTSGTSRALTITVNNTGSATTISGLEVEFEEKEDLLQVTDEGENSTYTEEGYWYVEMGTYSTTSNNAEGKRESEYLRWRYFSNTTSHYEFDRNTRPTGEGYFILESYYYSFASGNEGGLYVSWNNDYLNSSPYKHQLNGWTNIDANDYSTSTVRQYMNSEEERVQRYYTYSNSIYSPNDPASNMFIDLHIDPDNDIVYSQIIGRTLSDLYTNMGWNGSSSSPTFNNVTFPDLTNADPGYQYEKTDIDKFWLLSEYEAYNLLSDQDTMDASSTDREWGNYYWIRSPFSFGNFYAYVVNTSGNLNCTNLAHNYSSAARAAFKLSI